MAVPWTDFLDRFAAENPEYWAWLQSRPNALAKVKRLMADYAAQATGAGKQQYAALVAEIQGLKSYGTWQAGETEDDPPPTEEPPPEEDIVTTTTTTTTTEEPPAPGESPFDAAADLTGDVREALRAFLEDNELPMTLMSFIENAIAKKMPFAQIVAELRKTPEYLAAYPENALRKARGFSWQPESWIRAYRDQARSLAARFLGIEISNTEIAGLIARDKSLDEWAQTLRTWMDFQRWGPVVRGVLESELGFAITDDRLFAFMSPDIPTPELDRAYEMALLRGQPALIGLGVRPEEEAEMLRQFGLSPEQAFRGYQGVVGELPRSERLAAIQGEIERNIDRLPSGAGIFADTPFALLFRAIQLQDPEAIALLQNRMALETARFQAMGGPVRQGTALVGLATAAERAQG